MVLRRLAHNLQANCKMDLGEERLSMVVGTAKHCLLPELDREIGHGLLQRDDFGIFVSGLEKNLKLLFDVFSKNQHSLLQRCDETSEFRVHLFLSLAEQKRIDCGVYQTVDQSLQVHIDSLINSHLNNKTIDKDVYSNIMNYYKQRLIADKWKRHIGAVVGYLNFSEVLRCTRVRRSFSLSFLFSWSRFVEDLVWKAPIESNER